MQKTQTVCLIILTTIAVGFSLYFMQSVLLPFVIALFVVIGCRPVLEFFEHKLKLSRYVAFAVAFVMGTVLLIGFGLTTWFSINDLAKNSDKYIESFKSLQASLADLLGSHEDNSSTARTESSQPDSVDNDSVIDEIKATSKEAMKGLNELLESATTFLQSQIPRIAGALSSLLSYGVLILIFVFFLLMTPAADRQNRPAIIGEIESQVRKYLVTKTVISAVTGFAFGIVLWLFGVPLATLFGFLAFLLNFIPNFGPLISTLTPVPFLILNGQEAPIPAIICFLLIGSIQFVSGNVVETRIMGKSFDVNPVVLLLALVFFGLVWGIIGMFLATPIVSIAKIILEQHDSTRPLSELMAGRWMSQDNIA